MKSLLITIITICATFFQSVTMGQSKKENNIRQRAALLDSLNKHSISVLQLNKMYKHNSNFGRFDANKIVRKIILNNSDTLRYLTTNDKKIGAVLSQLYSISAVDFLLGLSNTEGNITIPHHSSSWVRKEDIPELLKLATVDVVTPQISQYVPFNYKNNPLRDASYKRIPMAINALNLIYSYISGQFPVANSLTPTYESVKSWYDSGKSREEYKLVLFTPVIKDMKFPIEKSLNKE